MSLIDDTDGYVVTVVAGRSMADIEHIAHQRLHGLVPEVVGQPLPIDLSQLVDYTLPSQGIHFLPVDDEELPGMWAFAQPTGEVGDDIEVLIRDSEWTRLHAGGRKAHHARGTVAHELGHVYLHVNQIRARIALGHGLPRQVDVREVKTYDNAEWQVPGAARFNHRREHPRRRPARVDLRNEREPDEVASSEARSARTATNTSPDMEVIPEHDRP